MPTRRRKPLTFIPRGVSDAVDSTNAPPGSMAVLQNLIPASHTRGLFVPRPASVEITNFAGTSMTGEVSAIFVNGSRIYGMIGSLAFPGYDVPFCFDAEAQDFIPIQNIAKAYLPLTQPSVGDWTPPAMAIVGERVVVTHPGYPGGMGNPAFGWFDISNFTLGTLAGNLTAGSNIIASIAGDGTSAPINDGVSPGQIIAGPGIPANTYITAVMNGTYSLNTTGNTQRGSNLLYNVGAITTPTGAPLVYGMYVTGSGIPIGTQVIGTGTFNLVTTANLTGQFSLSTFGDATKGSPNLTNVVNTNGIVVGMGISGPNIPANATVKSFAGTTITMTANATGTASQEAVLVSQQGKNTLSGVANVTGLMIGMTVSGLGIPNNTVVTQVSGNIVTISNVPTQTLTASQVTFGGGNTVTLSQAALATVTGDAINFSGGGSITISNPATANTNGVQLSISSGTPSNPVWFAGNTNQNALPSVPTSVTAFNTRAYFSCGNSVVVSDTLNAVQRSNAAYVLTLGDNQPVTVVAGLPLDNQVTGGVIQSVIAFKGTSGAFQVTGDPALNNWAQNAMNVSIGTAAPNAVTPTPYGLAFVAPDGVRIIDFNANVGDPIGAYGEGVSVPFINADSPSRMCAAYNQNVLRVSVLNNATGGGVIGVPQEWWYDFELKIWTGPHTFPFALIEAFYATTAFSSGHGFVGAGWQLPASLWAGEATTLAGVTYTENGVPLQWEWQTSLLPDNQNMSMNSVVQSTLGLILSANTQAYIVASDEAGRILDTVTILGPTGTPTIWGQFTWGQATWLVMIPPTLWDSFYWGEEPWQQQFPYYSQYGVSWHSPLVFKQMQVSVSGQSLVGFAIGNLYLEYEHLGYMIEQPLSAWYPIEPV